jgi:FAD/FMN-containing dehydrogenase
MIIARWSDPGESETHIRWTKELWEALKPYCTGGVYVNNIGTEVDSGASLVRAAYGANYEQLAKLKRKYDPTNVFRHNQNIRPMM